MIRKKTPRELLEEVKATIVFNGSIQDTIKILIELLETMIEKQENLGDDLIKELRNQTKLE